MLELNQFTGSSEFFKFNAFSKSIATEGIMHLCQKGNCSWLITDIDAHLIAGNKSKLMQAELMLVAIIKQDETTISKNSSLTATEIILLTNITAMLICLNLC